MSTSTRTIFSGMQLYANNQWLSAHALVVEGSRIAAIIPVESISHHLPAKHIEFSNKHLMIPGLIDMHVHGAAGADVMDGTLEAMQTLSETLAKEGVTGFLATTMTASPEKIEAVLPVVAKAATAVTGAAILGIHLEGPFIATNKAGAQDADFAQQPDYALFKQWQTLANNIIRVVTLAPELEGALAFIKALRKDSVIVSIGHTHASFEETQTAIQAGATQATHLFNAMRAIHQREPGPAVALLLSNEVTAELIVDAFHLQAGMVQLAYQQKGKDALMLVSDAMRAKCMKAGQYALGGQQVTVDEARKATLSDGTLAGSTVTLPQAIQRMVKITDCALEEAIEMTTKVPARCLGIESHKGSIAVGKDADLAVFDAAFECVLTLCEGKITYLA